MTLSAFDDRTHRPEPGEVARTLGKSASLWDALVTDTSNTYPSIHQEWNFAGAKFGWSLKLKQGDRVVLYMTPQPGEFLLGVILGEKAAVPAAHDAGVSRRVRDLVHRAPRYAEGRGIRLPTHNKADAVAARQLAALKLRTR